MLFLSLFCALVFIGGTKQFSCLTQAVVWLNLELREMCLYQPLLWEFPIMLGYMARLCQKRIFFFLVIVCRRVVKFNFSIFKGL